MQVLKLLKTLLHVNEERLDKKLTSTLTIRLCVQIATSQSGKGNLQK